jgi:hypothetical protein
MKSTVRFSGDPDYKEPAAHLLKKPEEYDEHDKFIESLPPGWKDSIKIYKPDPE